MVVKRMLTHVYHRSLRFISSRENEVREHIPVPYDNLFQSIFVFMPRCEKYI